MNNNTLLILVVVAFLLTMMFFSYAAVFLPDFTANGATIAGVIVGGFVTMAGALGARSLAERQNRKGNGGDEG